MDRAKLLQFLVTVLDENGKSIPDLTEATQVQGGLDLDSLSLAGVLVELEQHFDITILEDAHKVVTVGDLLTLIEHKIATGKARNAA